MTQEQFQSGQNSKGFTEKDISELADFINDLEAKKNDAMNDVADITRKIEIMIFYNRILTEEVERRKWNNLS